MPETVEREAEEPDTDGMAFSHSVTSSQRSQPFRYYFQSRQRLDRADDCVWLTYRTARCGAVRIPRVVGAVHPGFVGDFGFVLQLLLAVKEDSSSP